MSSVFLSFLAAFFIRLIAMTSRIHYVQREIRDRLEKTNKGFIYAFWHGRQVFMVYLHRGDRVHPLVSKSKDGEIIAQVCHRFGIQPVRGSSSRGGAKALLEIRQWLLSGDRIALTPDGPRGPLYSVQPGVLFLARKFGVPILPIAFGARRFWTFGSWDRFLIPTPFNRIVLAYGEPLSVSETDHFKERAGELERRLHAITALADRWAKTGQLPKSAQS